MQEQLIYPKMDLNKIPLKPQGNPSLARAKEGNGLFLNTSFSNDFRLRSAVMERLLRAINGLPIGYGLMLYEAYRPLARQIRMWNDVQLELRQKHPRMEGQEFQDLCETFIANPYDGIGSGHQAGCAVDIGLCSSSGETCDMGSPVHGFGAKAWTGAAGLEKDAHENRLILKTAMETAGFINYPAEWWHYSYGDHAWAFLTGESEAIYGPLDLAEGEGAP